jgi:hypothetical protein
MARVLTKTKSRGGKSATCGRCGAPIEPGEMYYSWTPYRSGTRTHCFRHAPRPSETTTSLLSEVYAAVESAQDQMEGAESIEDVKTLVAEVAEAAQSVAEQYREASEAFGGAGENAERADELESWASELEGFEPDEDDTDSDEFREPALREICGEVLSTPDAIDYSDQEAVIAVFMVDEAILEEKIREIRDEAGLDDMLETVRAEALELVGGCPL